MGFTRRESSGELVKKVSPSHSKKKNGTNSQTKYHFCSLSSMGSRNTSISMRFDGRGPVCKYRKQAAAVFPVSEEDDGIDNQFNSEGWTDESDCMWLSSNCKSPSFDFDDHNLWDVYKLDSCDLFLDKWFSSFLSRSSFFWGKGIQFFDGARLSPIEEASLVLERTSEAVERVWCDELKVKEVCWLLNSDEIDVKDSSMLCSETAELHYESSFCEDASVSDSALTSLSALDDSSSQIWEFDGANVWVSLLDLNREDSELILDKDFGLDVFQSDFPSPSYKSKWNSEVGSSHYGSSLSTEENFEELSYSLPYEPVTEAVIPDGTDSDEPLFWPFERKFDWNAEIASDCFCISPRRDRGPCEGFHSPKSIRLRIDGRKMDLKEGCKQRLVFNSDSIVTNSLEGRNIDGNKGTRRLRTLPSRLSRSSQDSMKTIHLEIKDNMEKHTNAKVPTETLVGDYEEFLEEGFSSNEEVSIETLIGLNEFDGHEGVDAEFNDAQFSLNA